MQICSSVGLFNYGILIDMHYLVALGNPGSEYINTRHNVGWLILDEVLATLNFSSKVSSGKYAGMVASGVIAGLEVTALYPDTFMNHSGVAVKKMVPKDELANLIVIYDDVALPLGEIRLSFDRGDGGHNGIRSIVAEMGSREFVRIRVGIAQKSFFTGRIKRPAGDKLARFVLGRFGSGEMATVEKVAKIVTEAIAVCVSAGKEKAMNQYNSQ